MAATDPYVCPRCGTDARGASFCSSCGLNLDAVELPRQTEFTGPQADLVESDVPSAVHQASTGDRASRLSRLAASILDGVSVNAAVFGVAALVGALGDDDVSNGGDIALGVVVIAAYLYGPLWIRFNAGATPGKAVMGIRVERQDGSHVGFPRALLRELIVKPVLMPLLFLSFWWSFFDREKRLLHDVVLNTHVRNS
jgi:uncharacterized RDD family membrane protein YckC/predicted RNA-binding Zn-ribbon protein involved in translation (DUF1610 family)